MPPVPNKHTSNIFTSYPDPQGTCPVGPLVFDFLQRPDIHTDSESDFYFKFAYNFIVALLAEVKFVQPVVFFREISPALGYFQYVLAGNPLDYRNTSATAVADDLVDFFCFFYSCMILAHTIPP